MKNIWTVVCRESLIDQDTNSLSMIDTLDEISVPRPESSEKGDITVIPISFHIVSLWFDENISKDRKFGLDIEVVDPKGKILKTFSQECLIPQGKDRLRTVSKIDGFGLNSDGIYEFAIRYREGQGAKKIAAKIPLSIRFLS